jgi:outer membrane lipoprotein-sorting protein
VTQLGEVLELMTRAGSSFRTVRATVRRWQHRERFERAYGRYLEAARGSVAVVSFSDEDDQVPPEEWEVVERLWWERPNRMRRESESTVTVTDGASGTHYVPGFGSVVHELEHGQAAEPPDPLFDPVALLASADLELLGRTVAAGREAIRVRALPRSGDEDWADFWGMTGGADEYELLVDAERGVLLRTEARLEGEPVGVTELLEVAFDEQFPEGTFRFEPPAGEPVRRPPSETQAQEMQAHFEELTLDEAARRASFPLFVPGELERGWELRVRHTPGGGELAEIEQVWIWLVPDDERGVSVLLDEQPAGAWGQLGSRWERVEQAGGEVFVREGSSVFEETRVRLEREGTAVELSGQGVESPFLLELAASLVRVSPEPPPIR